MPTSEDLKDLILPDLPHDGLRNHARLVGTIWEHAASGDRYMILGVATNPNSAEQVVVYWSLADNRGRSVGTDYWRPYGEFMEKFRRAHDG